MHRKSSFIFRPALLRRLILKLGSINIQIACLQDRSPLYKSTHLLIRRKPVVLGYLQLPYEKTYRLLIKEKNCNFFFYGYHINIMGDDKLFQYLTVLLFTFKQSYSCQLSCQMCFQNCLFYPREFNITIQTIGFYNFFMY